MRRRSLLRLGLLATILGGSTRSWLSAAQAKAKKSWQQFISQATFQRPLNRNTRVLEITTAPITVLGKTVERGCIRASDGQRGYTTRREQGVDLELVNKLPVPTTVHWHGLILPNPMDGVPYVTQPPIPPGERQRIHYPLQQDGTFWMHSHYGLQTQSFVAEPFLILSQEQEDWANQTLTVTLRDFSFTPADTILSNIVAGKRGGDTAMARALETFDWQAERPLLTQQWDATGERLCWRRQTGSLMLPDVVYDALLANERSLDAPQIIDVRPGDTVAIRWIAASAFMNFFLDLGELEGELLRTDANPVEPIRGSVFQLAIAQRLSLRIRLPDTPGVFPLLALGERSNLRCGVVLRSAPEQPIPALAPQTEQWTGPLDFTQDQQLRAQRPLVSKPTDNTIPVALTGPAPAYRWGLNNRFYPYRDPYWVEEGQRVEMVFSNPTPMGHPMHLHGHEFQVVEIDGQPLSGPMRDTVLVPKGSSCRIAFDALHPGIWAFHCHISYHHARGMFNVLAYRSADLSWWDPSGFTHEQLTFDEVDP
ncbi:multicopper oxidase family protein [Synechococcus sp. W4D4]|uniref:multicopper oxidase family protein n=1 Tax=Synechococcus sp. W4D4 TaxID=3392294 RepID=UPI0039EB5C9D